MRGQHTHSPPTTNHPAVGFDDQGQITQIATIDTATAAVTWGPVFHVASTDYGCNVAFAVEGSNGSASSAPATPVYYVPDGSQMQPPPFAYAYHTVAAPSGAFLRTVNASSAQDMPFVGYDATVGRVLGLGMAAGTADPPALVSFDPATGATTVDVADVDVQEMPTCVGVAARTGGGPRGDRGVFYFTNGIIQKTNAQELVTFDVGDRSVTARLLYPDGLITAIAPWTNSTDGAQRVLALLWPNAGPTALVALDPLARTWAPAVLATLPPAGSVTPIQGTMGVVGDHVYAILNDRASGGHVLMSADVGARPVKPALMPIDDSHAPFGVYAFGGVPV
jgi:hypothetical protein